MLGRPVTFQQPSHWSAERPAPGADDVFDIVRGNGPGGLVATAGHRHGLPCPNLLCAYQRRGCAALGLGHALIFAFTLGCIARPQQDQP